MHQLDSVPELLSPAPWAEEDLTNLDAEQLRGIVRLRRIAEQGTFAALVAERKISAEAFQQLAEARKA